MKGVVVFLLCCTQACAVASESDTGNTSGATASASYDASQAWEVSCQVVRASLCEQLSRDVIMDQIAASCHIAPDPMTYCASSGRGGLAIEQFLETGNMDGLELSEVAMLATTIEALQLPVDSNIGAPPGMAERIETLREELHKRIDEAKHTDTSDDDHNLWIAMAGIKGICGRRDLPYCLDWCLDQCVRNNRTDIVCARQCMDNNVQHYDWNNVRQRLQSLWGPDWESQLEERLKEKAAKKIIVTTSEGTSPIASAWASEAEGESFTLAQGLHVPWRVNNEEVTLLITWSAAAAIVLYAGFQLAQLATPVGLAKVLSYLLLLPEDVVEPGSRMAEILRTLDQPPL